MERRDSNSSFGGSDHSYHSWSTAPTVYSDRSSLKNYLTAESKHLTDLEEWRVSCFTNTDARSSVETYASTIASGGEFEEDEYPIYEEPEYYHEAAKPAALPSSPPEFAQFFPSTRRMWIRHDDTIDGNMNLRVDTERPSSENDKACLTLFHLRMHDLKNREFSFRRYCRDSGREVCHSSRKYTKSTMEYRPGFHRSMSNALASLRHKSENKLATTTNLKRQDSGYESMSEDEDDNRSERSSVKASTKGKIPLPTNTTKIEFANYAHVDLKRRGAQSSKCYEFDYWGTSYAWKRTASKNGKSKDISYHCYNTENGRPVAHIVPVPMTPAEVREEECKGGWVPPCSMWISDETVLSRLTDVADVIVSTGLLALVDDCIKRRWHQKDRFQLKIPVPLLSKGKLNMQYIGPKRLIDELFNRRGSTVTRHPTPSRQITA